MRIDPYAFRIDAGRERSSQIVPGDARRRSATSLTELTDVFNQVVHEVLETNTFSAPGQHRRLHPNERWLLHAVDGNTGVELCCCDLLALSVTACVE
jgi:hypothetical protein